MQREIDRYDNWRPLGSGGFGAVYRAHDRRLGREVAIKVINLPYFAETESERRRRDDHIRSILREPRLAAGLQHPNIITVHDFLVEEQQIYIVMEFLPDSLGGHILTERPIPYRRAVEIALQVCRGLSQAHNNGVVHRDIKPPNILLSEDLTVKIADFGLAREVASSSGIVPTQAIGTWQYAAPEQHWNNRLIDHRVDIYSLGVTLFEMLTGSLPFRGESRPVYIEHQEAPVPPIPGHLGVPSSVEDVVRRAMAKSPEDRFADAEAMGAALNGALTGTGDRQSAQPPHRDPFPPQSPPVASPRIISPFGEMRQPVAGESPPHDWNNPKRISTPRRPNLLDRIASRIIGAVLGLLGIVWFIQGILTIFDQDYWQGCLVLMGGLALMFSAILLGKRAALGSSDYIHPRLIPLCKFKISIAIALLGVILLVVGGTNSPG